MKVYQDFDLSIEKAGGRYRARVLNSPDGPGSSEFDLPFSDIELENFVLRFGQARRTMRSVRLAGETVNRSLSEFGTRLYAAIFSGQVSDRWQGSLGIVGQQADTGLRIRLRLSEAPELIDVPWEYLFDADSGRFLTLSVDTPVVRYLDLPGRVNPLPIQPPLQILVMISSPADYPPLDAEQEWKKLKDAVADLERRKLVVLERMERPTLSELQRRLRKHDIHVFHYIGHGGFDEATQDGVLILENDGGKAKPTSGKYLGTLLHDEKSVRLAVLNACEGGRTSQRDPFAGVGQSLVKQGIPAVVAMQFEISDQAAITLSQEFYAALADNYPVDAALAEARKAIFAQDNIVEWGTPVLYMRSQDGRIFDLASLPAAPAVATAQPQPATTPFFAQSLPQPQTAAADDISQPAATAGPLLTHFTPQPAQGTAASTRVEAPQAAQEFVARPQSTAARPAQRPAGAQAGKSRTPLLALIGVMAVVIVAGAAFILSRIDGGGSARPTEQPTVQPFAVARLVPTETPTTQPTTTKRPTATVRPTDTRRPAATKPPTSTATKRPTSTATRRPTSTIAIPVFSATQTMNVRGGPGTNYAVIGRLTAGQQFTITGRNASGDWLQFNFNGQTGWVSASLVQATGSLAAVAVVQAPPPPTLAPTRTPTPTPRLLVKPTLLIACRLQAGPTFARVWDRDTMGCPQGAESAVTSSYELFERGWMLWRQDLSADHWTFFDGDGYTVVQYPSDDPPNFSCAEAQAAGMPRRGFGRLWCERTDIRQRIGKALADEIGNNRSLQIFERGFMIYIKERGVIVSVYTNGTWKEQR